MPSHLHHVRGPGTATETYEQSWRGIAQAMGTGHFPPKLTVRKLSTDLGVVKQGKPTLRFRVPGNQ